MFVHASRTTCHGVTRIASLHGVTWKSGSMEDGIEGSTSRVFSSMSCLHCPIHSLLSIWPFRIGNPFFAQLLNYSSITLLSVLACCLSIPVAPSTGEIGGNRLTPVRITLTPRYSTLPLPSFAIDDLTISGECSTTWLIAFFRLLLFSLFQSNCWLWDAVCKVPPMSVAVMPVVAVPRIFSLLP